MLETFSFAEKEWMVWGIIEGVTFGKTAQISLSSQPLPTKGP